MSHSGLNINILSILRNTGVMIYLGQRGLCSLSASSGLYSDTVECNIFCIHEPKRSCCSTILWERIHTSLILVSMNRLSLVLFLLSINNMIEA